MSLPVETCVTLDEYRVQVLGLKQWDVAEGCRCSQQSVSLVERGWLPKSSSNLYAKLLKAYQLQRQEEHFVRMVKNAQRLAALKMHIADDFPLALFAQPSDEGLVVRIPPDHFLKDSISSERRLSS